MIDKLLTIQGPGLDPYANLALEEYLLGQVDSGECILYLWKNQKTVVIGRNQNSWKECRAELLEEEGGHMARRLSGGGAVFHDLGNLNFTFLVRKEDYDIRRQTEVILQAVRELGVDAERTGRNDITVEGRKFSGSAYYQSGDRCYHHGTLLLQTDKELMERYLHVSKEKLRSKSVDSVRGRVANLDEYVRGITPELMAEKLLEAYARVYAGEVEPWPESRLDQLRLDALEEKYASWEWRYGRKISFSAQSARKFVWGEVLLQIAVDEGRVIGVKLWTDALDTEFSALMEERLLGAAFTTVGFHQALVNPAALGGQRAQMMEDIKALLEDMVS